MQYFILMYFPLVAGGGVCCTTSNIASLSLEVAIRFLRFSKTSIAVSKAFNNLCLVIVEVKIIGTSVKGAMRSLIFSPPQSPNKD